MEDAHRSILRPSRIDIIETLDVGEELFVEDIFTEGMKQVVEVMMGRIKRETHRLGKVTCDVCDQCRPISACVFGAYADRYSVAK